MGESDLESLSITRIRGVVAPFTVPFDKHKKLCVVYGENGTGKTTLCDALELLGAGSVGSLDGRGLGQTARYLQPAGSPGGAGTIELKAKGASYKASVPANGKVAWTPDEQKPSIQVLRRPQLLRILAATAADRYKEVAALIDVGGVQASEQMLAKLEKDVEKDAERQAQQVAGAQGIIEKLFAETGGGGGTPLDWARGAVAPASPGPATSPFDALKAAYEALVRRAAGFAEASRSVENARAQVATSEKAITALGPQGDDAALLGLLEAASSALTSHRGDTCPLCESAEHAADLQKRVQDRLRAMKSLRQVRSQQSDANGALARANLRLTSQDTDYTNERKAYVELVGTHRVEVGIVDGSPESDPPTAVADLAAWLGSTASAKDTWSRRQVEITARALIGKQLRDALESYDTNFALAERSSKLHQVLARALARVQSTRHAFVNDLLSQISVEVGRLYERVHPGEGLGKISLSLDEKRRASLDLTTSFQAASDVPPQAYFSDSHLDTLGLCVFLALAKRRIAARTILVLDDILASVDEPHVDRLIAMICDEAEHFRHVVITTHYRPWREKLRWGWLNLNECDLIELGRWTPNQGPSLVRTTSEIERLRKLLAAAPSDFDGQSVCAKAGVVLEAVLTFLAELYASKVPCSSRDAWTLGDLLPAIGTKLRKVLRIEKQDPAASGGYQSHALGPILDELTKIAQTRNQVGAHFNKLSFQMLDVDAERFATKVLELADLIVHPEHGWPRSDKSGSYWQCREDARRLHPLREPK